MGFADTMRSEGRSVESVCRVLEHQVLASVDERAGAQLGDHRPIHAALLGKVNPAQVGVRVAQPGPADQPLKLGLVEGCVGIIDDVALNTFGERHADGELIVMGLQRGHQ